MEGLGLLRGGHWDLKDVSLAIAPGEAWGVVGPSGAGKSTLLNLVLALLEPSEGCITLLGRPWSPSPERERRPQRPQIQAVFQDAQASLPPHRTGWDILQEPLVVWKRGTAPSRREAAAHMAARVKFPETSLSQRPEAWSSGLAQRLCLGRALMLGPALLVLDEPFSALDATLGGHLRSLLLTLKAEGTALLLASHDLTAVRIVCDQLIFLRDGRTACRGAVGSLLSDPVHPDLLTMLEATPPLAVGGWPK